MGQAVLVSEILRIDGINQDFKPTLVEISELTKDYDLMKVIVA